MSYANSTPGHLCSSQLGGSPMTVRVGINGFGRIGRTVWRAIWSRPQDGIEVVLVNDIQPLDQLAYLLEFDTIRGQLPCAIDVRAGALDIDGHPLPVA